MMGKYIYLLIVCVLLFNIFVTAKEGANDRIECESKSQMCGNYICEQPLETRDSCPEDCDNVYALFKDCKGEIL